MKMGNTLLKSILAASVVLPLAAHADWSHHFYAGVGGGWQQTSVKVNNDLTVPSMTAYSSSTSINSNKGAGLGDVFIGVANEQGTAYWALEADAIYSNSTATTYQSVDRPAGSTDLDTYNIKMPWRYEADAIFGHYFSPSMLGFIKIGATTGRLELNYNTSYSGSTLANFSSTKQLYGGVLGLGTQFSLTQNLSLGIEGDYIRFGNAAQTVNSTYNIYPASYSLHYKPEQYMVKATLAYRFN